MPCSVVFVNRFFYPDHSATSQILSDLAFHLSGQGYQVTVVTSRLNYDDPAVMLPGRETIHDVTVLRVRTTRFGRGNLLGRAFDYASFYAAAFFCLLRILKSGDIVVAKTDPPLVSVVAAVAARIKGARLVNWLQDLFPEVGQALGVRVLRGAAGRLSLVARDWSLRRAIVNVAIGERMAILLGGRRIKGDRVAVIHNWADDRVIAPVAHDANPLRQEWGLENKFAVVYSGNLGRAHEFETILDAAQRLKLRDDIVFVFIGGGAQLDAVRAFVARHDLHNVLVKPYQPREKLIFSLGAGDLHLVSLMPALEGLIVPSKFYGIAAAGRPCAFIGDRDGEIARLLRRHEMGNGFAVGDDEGLAAYILELAGAPAECERLGANARRALGENWSQARAFSLWESALKQVRDSSSS